jgi:alpha-glucosidase
MNHRLLTFAAVLALAAGSAFAAPTPTTAAGNDDGAAVTGFVASSGPIVIDGFSPSIHRFFANAAAKEAAHPSYAIEKEPGASLKAPTADPKVKPILGTLDGKHTAKIIITPGTSLYGTGEAAGPLLRNGRRIVCWNTDAYGYGDEAESLYQSHPWVLAVRPDGTSFGILADTTYRCVVDTAHTNPNEVTFTADGPAFGVVIIEGATPQDVIKDLATLTGRMAMPPQWAVGYHQCRYSYFPEARVREIANEFRARKIPCDIIWYDIDYMEGFRVFTFDRGHFPDPKKLNADLHALGFKNVWMINPGIKSRDERSPNDAPQDVRDKEAAELKSARAKEHAHFKKIRDDGKANGVYVRKPDGSVYEGEVWPGWCYFPDFTSPSVKTWWGPWYKDFMAMGIDGVWNDMNEPAVFNVKSKTMPEDNKHAGDPTLIKPNGQPQGEAGAAGNHARYHNVYGMQMIKASREGIMAANPDKRPFVLSRANYIGGQRYGATWTGDNTANWYHVEVSIPMVLNVGLSGQPFIGPDIGGFAGNGDGDMFARWMGFGALFPFSRGHTGKDNIDKEPWSFGPKVEATSRAALEMRYKLLPYFYTLFHEATTNGLPIARPVFFADPTDPALRSEDDSFLLGDSLLVQAQVVPDRTRISPMPKGIWQTFSAPTDTDLPTIFIKGGSIVPGGPSVQFAQPGPEKQLTLTIAPDENGQATGTLYEDAGDGYGYRNGEFALTTYSATVRGDECTINVTKREGTLTVPPRDIAVTVLLTGGNGRTTAHTGVIKESEGGAVKLRVW